jgi:hypothetical protein
MSDYAHLLPTTYKATIASWLAEDTPSFDYGGYVVGEAPKTATLYCKSPVRAPSHPLLVGGILTSSREFSPASPSSPKSSPSSPAA